MDTKKSIGKACPGLQGLFEEMHLLAEGAYSKMPASSPAALSEMKIKPKVLAKLTLK